MALLSSTFLVDPINCFPNPKHSFGSHCPKELFVRHRNRNRNRNRRLSVTVSGKYEDQNLNESQPAESLRQFTASAILLLGLGIRVCAAAASTQTPAIAVADRPTVIEDHIIQGNDDVEKSRTMENLEDKELNKAFEKWKSKTYALTVPLRIVALRGSIPPSWVKDFMQSQGRRAILCSETCGSLDDIFSDISSSLTKGKFDRKSALAADIVTVGDSSLNFAIKKGLIEPLQGVEDQDWFKGLSDKWKKLGSIRISELNTIDPTNDKQILKAVKQQPVAGGVLVTQEFSDLKGGIYDGSENYLRCEKGRIGKHAVFIVGFGYDEKYKKYY